MDIRGKLEEFNKRFSFIEDISYQEQFDKFKTRIINIFNDVDFHVSDENITLFCQILGIPEIWNNGGSFGNSYSENIINSIKKENNEIKFYQILHIIFNLIEIKYSKEYGVEYSRNKLILQTLNAVNLSDINLSMTLKDNEVIFYPRGETTLDKILVNEVLSFLDVKTSKHFIDALNYYLNFTKSNAVKSAESVRRSIEEFLRFTLKNDKGLKENIDELLKWLKSDKCDSNIRNIIWKIFSHLDNYFNDNSKHKDGNIEEPENEFLIYQAGLLMRYINKISIR